MIEDFSSFRANSNTLAAALVALLVLCLMQCRNERINHETDADGTSSNDRTLFFLSTASPCCALLSFFCRSLGKPICRLTNTKEIDCDLAVSAAQSPAGTAADLTSLYIELAALLAGVALFRYATGCCWNMIIESADRNHHFLRADFGRSAYLFPVVLLVRFRRRSW